MFTLGSMNLVDSIHSSVVIFKEDKSVVVFDVHIFNISKLFKDLPQLSLARSSIKASNKDLTESLGISISFVVSGAIIIINQLVSFRKILAFLGGIVLIG